MENLINGFRSLPIILQFLACGLAGAVVFILLDKIFLYSRAFLMAYKMNKEHGKALKEKEKIVEEMKAKGEMHKWTRIEFEGKSYEVCEKTGWCPALKGFMDLKVIEAFKKAEQEKKDLIKFIDKKLENLCKFHEVDPKIVNKIILELSQAKTAYMEDRVKAMAQEFIARMTQEGNKTLH